MTQTFEQMQYPDAPILEWLAQKLELPVDKISVSTNFSTSSNWPITIIIRRNVPNIFKLFLVQMIDQLKSLVKLEKCIRE